MQDPYDLIFKFLIIFSDIIKLQERINDLRLLTVHTEKDDIMHINILIRGNLKTKLIT